MIWQRYPVFRVFLIFSAGIILANFVDTPFILSVQLIAVASVLVLVSAFSSKLFGNYSFRWIFGVTQSIFFFLCGIVATHFHTELQARNHLEIHNTKIESCLIQLLDDPQEKERSFGVKARILAVNDSTGTAARESNIMLYLQKSKAAETLSYGDQIWFDGGINELRGPMNPYEFDYRDFLNLKAIYYQAYADSTHWELVSSNNGKAVIKWAKDSRKKLLQVIEAWNLPKDQESVTKALLLGYRYEIQDDLMKAYSSAGAMHVLAVSGLHVGIVYLMAYYLLFFLGKMKYGTLLRTMILVMLLWSYAFLTGMSASVLRAATMFTFVAIGTGLKRYTSIYNTILGSAIVLLMWNPGFLFEVGFQLSYAAVFGIVWLQPRMQSLWVPRNWFVKQFWAITTVSIAAQIVTFPLGLYYFHQFPSLFLVSNWMVIPLVTGLMYVGLIALIISALGWIPFFLVDLYSLFLSLMNKGVGLVEELDFFLIDQVHISRFELVLLYAIILLIFNWFFLGGYLRLLSALTLTLLFSFSQIIESKKLNQQSQCIVYAVPNGLVLGAYQAGQGVLICDTSFYNDDDALTFHVKHHLWARDISRLSHYLPHENILSSALMKSNNLIGWNSKLFCVLQNGICEENTVWLAQANAYPPRESSGKPQLIILYGKSNFYQKKRWDEWATKNNIALWDTMLDGAFVLESNGKS